MAFQERVTIFIETKVDNARSQLGSFKQSVSEAQGATGKLKAAASGVGNMLGSVASSLTSPAGLAAGAAALATLGAKAVGAFQDLGVAVGKFRDATGTTSEQASRLVEVFDDLGVSPDTAAAALGRMSKTLATNKDALAEWGITAQKAADGSTDVQATFVAAVDAISKIKDPTQQAAAAQATFGRSWQQMAEVIQGGAPALQSALASVQDSKVFDDADVQKARDLRDALDSVKDAGEGLMLTLGKSLAPAITELAPKIADIGTKAEPIVKSLGESFVSAADGVGVLVSALGPLVGALNEIGTVKLPSGEDFNFVTAGGLSSAQMAWHQLTDDVKLAGSVSKDFAESAKAAGAAAGGTADDYAETADALKAWTDRTADQLQAIADQNKALEQQAAALNKISDAYGNAADDQIAYTDSVNELNAKLKDSSASTDDVRDAAITAAKAHAELYTSMTETSGATATATGKLDAQNQSLLTAAATAKGPARQAILDYIATLNGIPPEKMTEIQAAIDRGDLEEAQRLLDEASANRQATINADADTAQANRDIDHAARDRSSTISVDAVLRSNLPSSILKLLGVPGVQSLPPPAPAPTPQLLGAPFVSPSALASVNSMTKNRTVKVTFEPAGLDGLLGAFVGAVRKGTTTLVRVNGGG